jgi:competence protein ComEC
MFGQLRLIEFCAKLDFAFVETYFVDWLLFIFYYLVLVLVLTINKINYGARIAVIILLVMNFTVWKSVYEMTDKAEITYIDVGNSNSTLIKMPQRTTILVNTGSSSGKYTASERNIMPYLKTNGVRQVDLLLITSLNANEFKSLSYFVRNFPVNKIMLPVYYKPLFDDEKISSAFKKLNVEFVESFQIVNKQGKFRFYLYYDSLYKGESMMAELVYGSQSFLFNDSYDLNEDAVNTAYLPGDLNVQVLKTPGAGSFDYTSSEFLAKSNPEYVVISSSRSTRKKLSTDVYTKSLEHIGMNVLKTNENGAVIFRTNGETTEKVEWR